MDTIIDARFERVEKALACLIESVSKYHPHARQALDLHEADNDLARGLEEVQTHQNNHIRLQQLRATTASLDNQIKETLQNLAVTRKDITTTQITPQPDGPNYPVKYDELLNYARRISKTTLPPAAVINNFPTSSGTPPPDPNTSITTNPNTPAANGLQSQPVSAAPTPSQTQTPDPTGGPNGGSAQDLSATHQANTVTSLPDGLRNHLDPHFNASFIPWPNEFQIRSGAMAVFQDLQDKGIDPRGYDPQQIAEAKRKEEEERKAREEQDRLETERKNREYQEKMEKIRREQQEAYRRDSMAVGGAGASSAGKSKQFQFTSIMDDDDDED
ncbi:Mediator of RNA polymerase II transcription subunit 4 [Colletotrichum chlorophyti]|uniref:Mediator of RNA polymerase II transcription subunit 4 n=1 Tax=Colletotrichum chlorophyti TaxID=708187 RepID=A0A1Q8S9H2_9PEZI|nr:Mediator of RNA polymerase II transcription subunit 4 [Colletotrichum chlorophyti]